MAGFTAVETQVLIYMASAFFFCETSVWSRCFLLGRVRIVARFVSRGIDTRIRGIWLTRPWVVGAGVDLSCESFLKFSFPVAMIIFDGLQSQLVKSFGSSVSRELVFDAFGNVVVELCA